MATSGMTCEHEPACPLWPAKRGPIAICLMHDRHLAAASRLTSNDEILAPWHTALHIEQMRRMGVESVAEMPSADTLDHPEEMAKRLALARDKPIFDWGTP